MPLFGPPNIEKLKEKVDVEGLLKALGHKDHIVRLKAENALNELGTAAVRPLIKKGVLHYGNENVRNAAVEALRKLGEAGVETIIALLEDQDWWVRYGAAEALGELKDARAVEPLIAALEDKEWSVRSDAAGALGELKDARAVEPLITALVDKNPMVRVQAAGALVKLGDPRAAEPLISALKDGDDQQRIEATEALRKLGAAAVEPLIAALQAPVFAALQDKFPVVPGIAELMTHMGPEAVEALIAHLEDDNVGARRWAAVVLGEMKDAQAVEPLIAALQGEDDNVREAAANALERIGGPEAERALAEYRHQRQA
jgi:HEAT repeat protein